MPTLNTIILGNISVELEYTVSPYEPATHDCPEVVSELNLGDCVAVIDNMECGCRSREEIELEGYIHPTELERIRVEAWHEYNNYPGTP